MKTKLAGLLLFFCGAIAAPAVTVAWDDNSTGETGFTVQRAAGAAPAESAWAPLAELAANVTSYLDGTAVPGTVYSYRVRANAGNTPSKWSNVATYVAAPTTAKTAPTRTEYLLIRPGDSYTVKGSQNATRPGSKTINVAENTDLVIQSRRQ